MPSVISSRRSRRGTGALAALIERHQVAALRVATAIVGSGGQAEDVVQEAFIKSFTRLDQFDRGPELQGVAPRDRHERGPQPAPGRRCRDALTLRLATPEHRPARHVN